MNETRAMMDIFCVVVDDITSPIIKLSHQEASYKVFSAVQSLFTAWLDSLEAT